MKVGDGAQVVPVNGNCRDSHETDTAIVFGGAPKHRVLRMSSYRAPAMNAPYVTGKKQ
jgi:hypothetical protein